MKNFKLTTFIALLSILPFISYSQAPQLGKVASFVIFSSNGPISNTGNSYITGDVGTNNGSNTAFGNVNGVMHSADSSSAMAATDLLTAYNSLNAAIPTFFPSSLMGNGLVFVPGVYSIPSAATLNLNLFLDAQGDPNAVFIIQIGGPLSTSVGSKVRLINGALACNVFWKIEGLVSLASNTTMVGTIIANNAAIEMNVGDTLEGRALSTTGAITISGVLIDKPIGCGSTLLTGPTAPVMGKVECYTLFSASGAVSNTGISTITGDVGSNSGAVSGFDPLTINGTLHLIPDVSTSDAAADLLIAYTHLNTLSHDIELLFPAQFGHNLVLTPHTYLLNAATNFTDTLYLDAQGNANAVFVLKVNGAFSTSTYAKVLLINGAKAENVYWKIDGALNINDYSEFKGNIICNNAAQSNLTTGVKVDGRVLINIGAVAVNAVTIVPATQSANCIQSGINTYNKSFVSVSPNPFSTYLNVKFDEAMISNSQFIIYNSLGQLVESIRLTEKNTTINTELFKEGFYFYTLLNEKSVLQTGKLIIQ